MQNGTVAKKIGLSVDAIRFYERNALLPRPPGSQGGFRQDGENDLETLAFIRRVQGLGFKLREIRGFLNLRGNRLQRCATVRRRFFPPASFLKLPFDLKWTLSSSIGNWIVANHNGGQASTRNYSAEGA